MANTYDLITTTTLGSSASSFSFTNIDGIFTDLLFMMCLRQDVGYQDMYFTINNDTSSLYNAKWMYGYNAGGYDTTASNEAKGRLYGMTCGSHQAANCFSNSSFYIYNANSATLEKNYQAYGGQVNNAATQANVIMSGRYASTNVVSSVQILADAGANFVTYSTISLYGMKKS